MDEAQRQLQRALNTALPEQLAEAVVSRLGSFAKEDLLSLAAAALQAAGSKIRCFSPAPFTQTEAGTQPALTAHAVLA